VLLPTPPPPPPATTNISTAASKFKLKVPLLVNVWYVYCPLIEISPPVAFATSMLNDLFVEFPPESVAAIIKIEFPAPVAVPLISPVLEFRLRPAGNSPEIKEYEIVPPSGSVAEIVDEYWLEVRGGKAPEAVTQTGSPPAVMLEVVVA
jgi:hypothetical protein